nr:hypothetical protein BgiMline_025619 [Biomphalaria glabrata]
MERAKQQARLRGPSSRPVWKGKTASRLGRQNNGAVWEGLTAHPYGSSKAADLSGRSKRASPYGRAEQQGPSKRNKPLARLGGQNTRFVSCSLVVGLLTPQSISTVTGCRYILNE